MAITKRKEVDQIIVDPTIGTINWREVTIIEEDGVELTRTNHRGSVMIDEDIPAHAPAEVSQFRPLVDTPEARSKLTTIKANRKFKA